MVVVEQQNKDRFCKTIASVALLTPIFKEICDCRQRKFSQPVIQHKQSHKVSLKPGKIARLFCVPEMVFNPEHERISKEGGYI